jgi:hypothetical protein
MVLERATSDRYFPLFLSISISHELEKDLHLTQPNL